ncbi:MAG: DUF2948 family protein [Hyphomonadaceae bacterium]|nr:DUF2948 family protein [Hyphomonadaceae bacterium]
MTTPAPLTLLAADLADLDVISAAVQDAIVRVKDLSFDARARRFTAAIDRFRWEAARETGPFERVRAGLAFDGVLNVRTRRLRRDAPEAIAALLSIAFLPDEEPPGGVVRLVLAGGGEVELQVECLDATLADFGAPWRTPRRPDHLDGAG